MLRAPIPDNEAARLSALKGLDILDSPPEERFDRLTRLARNYFDVPIALVSLVDANRQWFKSRQGLDACETGRDISFCGHALVESNIFHIADATQDSRFADNPLVVGPPNLRFYAGAQIRTEDGYTIGTLCIIAPYPRDLSEQDRRVLRDLADCVEQELSRQELLGLTRKLEEARQEAESAKQIAEDANKLKDKFVSLIAHDLRNPIGAIKGMTELILTDDQVTLDEETLSSIKYVNEQSVQVLSLLTELLDLSRFQTGNIHVDLAFCDAHFLAEDLINRMKHQAKAKGIALVNDIPQRTRVLVDCNLFGQVLQNLLSNAIKFSHTNGAIRLFAQSNGMTTIAVSDQGVGIPVDGVDKLFALEEKTSTIGTAGEVGTGFGLPLSRQIVQAHKGDIRVESQEGAGSTFYVDLPTVRPTVLVVDDDEYMRKILSAYLAKEDVSVITAENGCRAMKHIVDGEKLDLIITDINMPEMNGLELLSQIKANPNLKSVPVVVLTGDESVDAKDTIFRLGADDFTAKPINPVHFLPRIRHFIG